MTCSVCQMHVGFPNVRAAEDADEQAALQQRYEEARVAAVAKGAELQLDDFERAVDSSQAVMAKRWDTVSQIVDQGGELFKTFYRQVEDGDREPQDNGLDQQRQAVDAMLFPHYLNEISFAALSLDGRGPESYGTCHLTFRTETIAGRASLFEKNTLVFARERSLPATSGPEPGFRSNWESRSRLAVAKLADAVDVSTVPDDYPDILLKQNGSTETDDFVEVHINGKLTQQCVESYRLPKPKDKDEQVFWRSLTKKLNEASATERKD